MYAPQGSSDVFVLDAGSTLNIDDRARNLQHAIVATHRERRG